MKRLLNLDTPSRRGIDTATAWTFYIEGDRFFEGTRSFFTADDITAPVVNAYEILRRLTGRRLEVKSDNLDVDAIATVADDGVVRIALFHHVDDQHAGNTTVTTHLSLSGLPIRSGEVTATQYRIDAEHSNSHTAWVAEGRPQDPDADQLARIHAASGLARTSSEVVTGTTDRLRLSVELGRPAAVLIEIAPEGA
jgi:xylan 1,4-beta-xylosidase